MRKLNIHSFYFEDFTFICIPKKLSAHFSPQPDSPLDHRFSTYQVNVMQSCDLCGSYIWGMERAYMCSGECKQEQKLQCYKRAIQHTALRYSTVHFCLFHFSLQANLSQKMSEQNHHRLLHAMCQEGKWHFEYSDYHNSKIGQYNGSLTCSAASYVYICLLLPGCQWARLPPLWGACVQPNQ